jgi:hypothetical protein
MSVSRFWHILGTIGMVVATAILWGAVAMLLIQAFA